MSLVKGNYKLKKNIKQKKLSKEEELELQFEKEATKRIGGSMVYVKKKKINWDLKGIILSKITRSIIIKLKVF